MNSVTTIPANEIKSGIIAARSKDPGSTLKFKLRVDWGQLYCKDGDVEDLICCFSPSTLEEPEKSRFSFPTHVRGKVVHSFDELYERAKEWMATKVAEKQKDAQLLERVLQIGHKREYVRNCTYIYHFAQPITDEEFKAFGRHRDLVPFTCPCGFWRRESDRSFYVNESTD